MPGMSGTEFLREARKLYPDARKVLLTAYADTEAAIASINQVGLDHYLLKPWTLPPSGSTRSSTTCCRDWTAHVRPPFEGMRVLGSSWSPQCYRR